VIEALAGCW